MWAHALLLSAEQLESGRCSELFELIRRPDDTSTEACATPLRWPQLAPPVTVARGLARALAEAYTGSGEHCPTGRPVE